MMPIKKVVYYFGKLGKPVTSFDELVKLVEQKRAIAASRDGGKTATAVFPASTLLYRQAKDAFDMLQSNTLYEYIKPVRAAKSDSNSRWYKTKKPGLQDKINAAIQEVFDMVNEDHSLECHRVTNILHVLSPDLLEIAINDGWDVARDKFLYKLEESKKK